MTDASPHPLSLERVLFTKSIVEAIPEHQPGTGVIVPPPENVLEVAKAEDEERVYQVALRCILNAARDPAYPYFAHMECIAVFRVSETLDDAEARRGALITGHNVLYGAVREAVAWITGRQVFGPMILGLSILKLQPPNEASPTTTPPQSP